MVEKYNYQKESFEEKVKRLIKMSLRQFRYFRLPKKNAIKDTVFFVIDPSMKHPGFADRIKSIVNTYYIAKNSGLKFKLYFKDPFALSKYLVPNAVDWDMELPDLDYSLFSSRLAAYTAKQPIPIWNHGRAYHVFWYRGIDMLFHSCNIRIKDKDSARKEWVCVFKTCFDELFKHTEHLNNLIASTKLDGRSFISVHFRFVNALGHFEDAGKNFPVLPEEQQKKLISDCLDCLHKIQVRHNGKPIYIFSDSEKFVNICMTKGYNRIYGGQIGHVSFAKDGSSEDKAMLDFFTMGRSEKVYAVVLPHMYVGVFSEYAAIVGGAEFERIIE